MIFLIKKKILEDTIYDTEADPILYIPRKNVSKVLDVFDPEVSNKNNINPIPLMRYKSENNRTKKYVNEKNRNIQTLLNKAKLRQTKNNTNNTNNLNRFSNRSPSPNF